ncbi:MAG: ABC transporter permease, partial [Epsilonproteobacteria bacterium]|nr:ABC transporter permease [Campylobacterota bacterium]
RDDAQIAKGRSDVAAIRAAIVSERQSRLLQGSSAYINKLDNLAGATSNDGDLLFDHNGTTSSVLLQYGISSKNADGHWRKTAVNVYRFKIMGNDVTFTYTQGTGSFDCNHADANCKLLTE